MIIILERIRYYQMDMVNPRDNYLNLIDLFENEVEPPLAQSARFPDGEESELPDKTKKGFLDDTEVNEE